MHKIELKFSDLWRWDGTVGRMVYLFLGVALFFIKYNIDRFIACEFFHRDWRLFDYFHQDEPWANADRRVFYRVLLTLALPFIWTGVVLTLRRLRSAGFTQGWVVLFFAPFVNLVFFALLCIVPPRNKPRNAQDRRRGLSIVFDTVIPESKWGSAAAAVFTTICLTIAGTAFSTSVLFSYGAGLFVGMPFCLGMISVVIYGYHQPRTFRESMMVCVCSIIVAGLGLLAVAFEGAIACLWRHRWPWFWHCWAVPQHMP
jgi:uncharacterized membrane protein YhaH (DUF805 family)